MFKKTERKIVATVMVSMILLLTVTLSIIYFTSYRDIYQNNQAMLSLYIESYAQNGNPEERTGTPGDGVLNSPDDDSNISSDSMAGERPDDAADNMPDEQPDDSSTAPDASDNLPDISDTAPDNAPDDAPDRNSSDVQVESFLLSTFYSVAFENGEAVSIDSGESLLYSDAQLVDFASSILEKGKTSGTQGSLVYQIADIDDVQLVVMMDNTIVGESITSLFKYTLLFGGIACVAIFFLAFFLAKQIIKPLQNSYEQQKQFVSDAGHELKTPVAAINANTEILSREIGDNQWLTNIRYENDRMTGVIRSLLELSKTEHTTPVMTRIDFSRVVMQEALSFEAVAYEKGHSLDTANIQKDVFVSGNEEQLRQLASILLDNAIEHSTAGGAVSISMEAKRHRACLSVSNEGEAIPDEQQKLIFERFYRTDYSRAGDNNHYGLGLAIAKAIVTAHKGEISVECKDGIVVFKVVIPV